MDSTKSAGCFIVYLCGTVLRWCCWPCTPSDFLSKWRVLSGVLVLDFSKEMVTEPVLHCPKHRGVWLPWQRKSNFIDYYLCVVKCNYTKLLLPVSRGSSALHLLNPRVTKCCSKPELLLMLFQVTSYSIWVFIKNKLGRTPMWSYQQTDLEIWIIIEQLHNRNQSKLTHDSNSW